MPSLALLCLVRPCPVHVFLASSGLTGSRPVLPFLALVTFPRFVWLCLTRPCLAVPLVLLAFSGLLLLLAWRVSSGLILSRFALPYPVLAGFAGVCLILPCPFALPCLTVSFVALSGLVFPFLVLSCLALPCLVWSILPFLALPGFTLFGLAF